MAGTTAAVAKIAGRRLKSVSGHIGGSSLVVVLPDDSCITRSAILGSPSSTRLELDGDPLLQYTIDLDQQFALDLSAFGTPFEGKTKHVPKHPVIRLSPCDNGPAACSIPDFWGALHALFTLYHEQEQIPTLLSPSIQNAAELAEYVLHSGLGRFYPSHTPRKQSSYDPSRDILFISRSGFWQGAGTQGYHTRSWLRNPRPVFPMISSFTRAENVIAKHPLRPTKPRSGELLYKRWCAHVEQMLELRYFDVEGFADSASYKQLQKEGKAQHGVSEHLASFHKWHNDERIAAAWGEQGSLDDHRKYIEKVTTDPHVLPAIFSWDGELMGYIEIVYTKEDHSAVYFPFGDPTGEWDRGIHVLVGEEKFLGHGRAEIWLRALPHYIFLDDPRANRVVGEPNAENKPMIRIGDKTGFHFILNFDFPYKRSALMVYSRDKFFGAHCHLY